MTKKLNDPKLKEEQNTPLNENKKFFCSHDIGLVACLLCQKFELVGMDKTISRKVLFKIKANKDIDVAIKNYWDFKSSVDAQGYFNQIKRLKNQIFSS